jgi:hypothetical protein
MGCWKILTKSDPAIDLARPGFRPRRSSALPAIGMARPGRGEGGFSLVELTVALFLVITIAVFGLQTIVSGWMLQNWSIAQSMTDSYASIETANAQRWVFNNIEPSRRWPVYPASTSTQVTIGVSPHGPVTATVIRTYHRYPPNPGALNPGPVDLVTGAVSYLLESYVIYQDGKRQYCKVSKVYRDE